MKRRWRIPCIAIGIAIAVVVATVASWLLWRGGERFPLPLGLRSIVASAPGSPEEEDRLLRLEQLEVLRKLVETYPDSADALHFLGVFYGDQGDYAQALKCWEMALRLDPDKPDVLTCMGSVAVFKEDYGKAEELYRKALGLDPGNAETASKLTQILMRQGRFQEVVAVLGRMKKLGPELECTLGEACLRLKDLERAKLCFERALQTDPALASALYGLGTICGRLGEKERSKDLLEKFQRIRTAERDSGRGRRELLEFKEKTAQFFARLHTSAGQVYSFRGDMGQAESLWLRAAAVDPKNVACRMELVDRYLATNRNAQAIALYEELVAIAPKDFRHYVDLAGQYIAMGRLEEAEAILLRGVAAAPQRPEGHSALAEFYLSTKQKLRETLHHAGEAVRLAPSAENHFILARACQRTGDVAGARAALGKAIELDPENQGYRRALKALSDRR